MLKGYGVSMLGVKISVFDFQNVQFLLACFYIYSKIIKISSRHAEISLIIDTLINLDKKIAFSIFLKKCIH